jgi:protoheme IX farnesyltransferase
MAAETVMPAAPAQVAAATAASRPLRAVAADYYQISKPRILYLLLLVAYAAMFVAQGGLPAWQPLVAVTIAGAASVASAGAFNNVIERERDARMKRTAQRPVASGRLSVTGALAYAAAMAVASALALLAFGMWVSALFTLGAIAYYVLVYTVLLKPTTPQNIVIGGLAGSFPALIGWTAVNPSLAWPAVAPALLLAGLVFLWTPPHFWALALLYQEDYANANYPMMPQVRGERSTRMQMAVYALLTVAASIALFVVGAGGRLYLGIALLLGVGLLLRTMQLLAKPSAPVYRRYFFTTIMYLGFLLLGLTVDRLLPHVFG